MKATSRIVKKPAAAGFFMLRASVHGFILVNKLLHCPKLVQLLDCHFWCIKANMFIALVFILPYLGAFFASRVHYFAKMHEDSDVAGCFIFIARRSHGAGNARGVCVFRVRYSA